jgi:hypothetical protein
LFAISIVVIGVAKMDYNCDKIVAPVVVVVVVVGLALLYTLDYYLMDAPPPRNV